MFSKKNLLCFSVNTMSNKCITNHKKKLKSYDLFHRSTENEQNVGAEDLETDFF